MLLVVQGLLYNVQGLASALFEKKYQLYSWRGIIVHLRNGQIYTILKKTLNPLEK
jgi:hypothetical protein